MHLNGAICKLKRRGLRADPLGTPQETTWVNDLAYLMDTDLDLSIRYDWKDSRAVPVSPVKQKTPMTLQSER